MVARWRHVEIFLSNLIVTRSAKIALPTFQKSVEKIDSPPKTLLRD
jgi:hypothetical protein